MALLVVSVGLGQEPACIRIYLEMISQTVVVVVLGSMVAKVAKEARILLSSLHFLTRVAKVTKTTVTVY